LVAGVAHEINTPIGIAVTAASKLTEINADASERLSQGRMTKSDLGQWQAQNQEGQTLVLRSLERASRLISSFKRVAVDQSSEERRNFDLRAFFDEVQTTFAPSFKRSPHRLVVDLAESATLDSYPGALFQVFTNLIENAVTHAFADGQSGTMRIEVLPPQRGSLEIRFSDDGSGMSEDVRSKAFEPFFTTRRDQGGSGLGLHLVHNLITGLMGGDIALGSAEGRGTQFILHVPLVAPRR
jgi:signal transduction histidine kinase